MIKNVFLRAFLCVSFVTTNVRCESVFYQGVDWGVRALRVSALAIVAKNFIYSKQTMQNMVDLQKKNIVDVLSPRAKEWIKNVLLEQCLTQEQVNNVTLISGFQENNNEHLAVVVVGAHCIYLSLHREYAVMLNELLEKDTLIDEEKQKLNIMRFLVGHESIHIKKYYSSSFSVCRQHQVLCSAVGIVSALITYELLRYYDFSRLSSTLISYIPSILALLYSTDFVLREERECDLFASQDPEILKVGAAFFQAIKPSTIAYLNNHFRGILNEYQLNQVYNENKYLIAVMTKHPHPDDRAVYLRARAQELEAAQLSAQAA